MKVRIARSEVLVGERFWSVPEPKPEYAAGCLAIDSKFMNRALKARFFGGAGHLWHTCLFNGQVSYNYAGTMVWVDR